MESNIICDAGLKWKISNLAEYEKWCRKGLVIRTPTKIKADEFILDIAEQFDGEIAIISNDLFSDYPRIKDLKAAFSMASYFLLESSLSNVWNFLKV